MRWILAPSDFDAESRTMGYLGHIGKHLAKTKLIEGIRPSHTFPLKGRTDLPVFQFGREDVFITHYWGGSFKDVILKCLYCKGVHHSKQSSIEEVIACHSPHTLPRRVRLMAALTQHKRYIKVPDLMKEKLISHWRMNCLLV